jgi:hypothetical protein
MIRENKSGLLLSNKGRLRARILQYDQHNFFLQFIYNWSATEKTEKTDDRVATYVDGRSKQHVVGSE